jgi:hypothetical protein
VELGSRIDETGTLLRDGGGFVLRRDTGGRWGLDLSRAPVDRIEKHVRIIGTLVADGRVEVEAIGPAGTLFGNID